MPTYIRVFKSKHIIFCTHIFELLTLKSKNKPIMGHTIPYLGLGKFVLFIELPRSFYPHLDDKWDQTCKIIKFTVKLARPYYTSPYFLHIKALLSKYKIHKHLYKVKTGFPKTWSIYALFIILFGCGYVTSSLAIPCL